MATYIQGITDYIPQIQPFTPDLNFYGKALTFKQSKYDAGKEQLNNLYGSLLNSDLSREDNIQARDKFFEIINQDIKRMSGLDLSKQQNVEMASNVFNQLLDDQYISHDMVFTKNWKSQIGKGRALKNCVDTEDNKCGGQWWEGGDQLMQYNMQAFKEAEADEALRMSPEEYVPAQNVMKMALELSKEHDMDVKFDRVEGRYLVSYKNGKYLEKPLSQMFSGVIGQDPKVKAYYNAQSKLARLNYSTQNAEKFGSKEAAEQDYINNIIDSQIEEANNTFLKIKDDIRIIDTSIKNAEKAIAGTKSETVKDRYRKGLESAKEQKALYLKSEQFYQDQINQIENAQLNKTFTGQQIDGLIGSSLLGRDINNAAVSIANLTASKTMKADQYALADHNHKLRMFEAKYKHQLNKDLEKYKKTLEDDEQKPKVVEGLNLKNVPGSVDTKNDNYQAAFDVPKNMMETIQSDKSQSQVRLLKKVLDGANVEIDKIGNGSAEFMKLEIGKASLDAQIKKDMQRFRNVISEEDAAVLVERNAKLVKLKEAVDKAPSSIEKLALLDSEPSIFAFSNMSSEDLNSIYSKTVKPYTELKTEQYNNAEDDYLLNVLNTYEYDVQNINQTDQLLIKASEGLQRTHNEIVSEVYKSNDYKPIEKAAIKNYYTDGYVTPRKEFIQKMTSDGFGSEEAAELYSEFDEFDEVNYNYDYYEDVNPDFNGGGYLDRDTDEDPEVERLYRNAYAKYGKLQGVTGFAQTQGLGDVAAAGITYDVNAKDYGVMGVEIVRSSLREITGENTDNWIISPNYFEEEIPDVSKEDKQKYVEMLDQLKLQMSESLKKDDIRMKVTAVAVAGGDGNMMAINIRPNKKFADAFWDEGSGSDKKVYEQFTLYVPKDKTNNVYKKAIEYSPITSSMALSGEFDFMDNDYVKEPQIKYDRNNNVYNFTARVANGKLNEQGQSIYQAQTMSFSGGQSLNAIYQKVNDHINAIYMHNYNLNKNP